jgi:hypothetical protein
MLTDFSRYLATSLCGVLLIALHRHRVHLHLLKYHLPQRAFHPNSFWYYSYHTKSFPASVNPLRNNFLSCALWLHRCQVLPLRNQVNPVI